MPTADQMLAPRSDEEAAQSSAWPAVLSPSVSDSRPCSSNGSWAVRRTIVRGRSALLRMRLDEAAKVIARLDRQLSNRTHSERVHYCRALQMLQAWRLALGDDVAGARNALATLPSHRSDLVSATILRYVDWKSGACEQACAPEAIDYLAAPARGQVAYTILNLCMSAAMAFERLHLPVCASLAAEALRLAEEHCGSHSPISCLPAILLAQVAYEHGRFEEAGILLAPRLAAIRASAFPECILRATVLIARLSFHRGRPRTALTTLREAEVLGRLRRWPRLVAVACSEHARISHFMRLAEVPSSARDCSGSDRPDRTTDNRAMIVNALCALVETTSSHGHGLSMPPAGLSSVEPPHFATLVNALVQLTSARSAPLHDERYGLLISCLRIGAAHGLRMIFVDAGLQVLDLLKQLYREPPTNDTQSFDLRAYIATILNVTSPVAVPEPIPPTYRQLSRRETGILKLIAHGMSNKRIALSLGIAPETVKTHAKSIFAKLSTRTRAQAVARAEAIGLL